jgi:hypothetical protein
LFVHGWCGVGVAWQHPDTTPPDSFFHTNRSYLPVDGKLVNRVEDPHTWLANVELSVSATLDLPGGSLTEVESNELPELPRRREFLFDALTPGLWWVTLQNPLLG